MESKKDNHRDAETQSGREEASSQESGGQDDYGLMYRLFAKNNILVEMRGGKLHLGTKFNFAHNLEFGCQRKNVSKEGN